MRDNQRKSRARKQEHVRDLEQKLAVYKEQINQKDIEHRLAMQKMEAENRQLKTLLGSVGVSPELIQQYLQVAVHDTEMDRKVAIPAMKRQSTTTLNSSCTTGENVERWPAQHGSCVPAESAPAEQPGDKSVDAVNPSLCKCPAEGQDSNTWPREEDVLNSTMCAIAEELVNQYNIRGADTEEIRRRLWSGFRTGSAGDGCRVQNQVLFQVLDELSNDV